MSAWMKNERERPERIVSSDAARARATTEYVRTGFSISADRMVLEHRLYEASPVTIRDVVRELPGDCASAALVGHNPGFTDFVNAMVGRHVVDQLPTFGIALLDVPAPWSDVRFGTARLVALYTPKTLRG